MGYGNYDLNKYLNTQNVQNSEINSSYENNVDNVDEEINIFTDTKADTDNANAQYGNINVSEYLDNDTQEVIISQFEAELKELESEFRESNEQKGWISGLWDNFKNLTGIGAGSDKTRKQINTMRQAIADFRNGKADINKTYKTITESDLTYEELQKFAEGEVKSKASTSLEKYTEGQKMCVDTVGDILSGIASVGAVALGSVVGICAAPFTAGASLGLIAAGVGLGAAVGTAVKVGVKASDCIGNKKKYGLKDLGYDTVTGAINGAMGPVTNALGGAAGTAAMKAMGMEALETTVKSTALAGAKEVIEEGAESVVKQGGKQIIKRAIASSVDMAVDGSLSGAADGFSRAIASGDDILSNTASGFVGGLIASPIIGGGFKAAGKLGSKLGGTKAGQTFGRVIKNAAGNAGDSLADIMPESLSKGLSNIYDNLNEKVIATSLKNCLTKNADGTFDVKVGKYIVKLAESEVTEEMLSDTSNKMVYEYATEILRKALAGEAAEEITDSASEAAAKETSEDLAEGVSEPAIKETSEIASETAVESTARETSESAGEAVVSAAADKAGKVTREELFEKIQTQLHITTEEEVNHTIKSIMSLGASEEEAIAALAYMTQFGNVKSLQTELGKISGEIGGFYQSSGSVVTANSALSYFCGNKQQIPLNGSKLGFILDDAGLKYLEKNGLSGLPKDTVFINIEGIDHGVSVLSQGMDESEISQNALKLIQQARTYQASGLSFEESIKKAMSSETYERAKALGIDTQSIKTLSSIQDLNGINAQKIANSLTPLNVSEKKLYKIIDTLAEVAFPGEPDNAARAKQLLIEYFNEELDIYSPERLGKKMKDIHSRISDTISMLVKSDGSPFTMDDVYFLVPEKSKSYSYVYYQYAKLNNVDTSHFISKKAKQIPYLDNDKIFVAFDDVVGSGESMLIQSDGYQYKNINFNKLKSNQHIIMAPIVSGSTGADRISQEITAMGRQGKDFLLLDKSQVKIRLEDSDFFKQLPSEDRIMLEQLIDAYGTRGFLDQASYGIVFPYMAPDNDAAICEFLFRELLLDNYSIKSKANTPQATQATDLLKQFRES